MILDHLNLNHLRVFECVYRTGSMTTAAQELHLTQSGVSQHIKSLEDMLAVRLFDRIQQRLVPTAASRTLFEHCSKGLGQIEEGLLVLQGQEKELRGTVTIGMPIEFGNNLVAPLLARFSRKHPLVKFKLTLGFASAINEELLKGAMDFAFVDDFKMDRRVATESVYDETLELCIAENRAKKLTKEMSALKNASPKDQAVFFESLDYVEYADGEPILRMWFSHHLGARVAKDLRFNVKATVMDVQGVARLITNEVGSGVLPGYLVSKLAADGYKLHRFDGCGKPVVNRISAAYLHDRTQSPAASAALRFLKGALKPAAHAAKA